VSQISHYAECRYAECRYAQRRGTAVADVLAIKVLTGVKTVFVFLLADLLYFNKLVLGHHFSGITILL